MNESEIVIRAQKGDRDALGKLFDLYFTKVYRTALFLSRSEEDAKDISQQVFIQVFRKIGSLKNPESFGFWIYKIVRNNAYLHNKRKAALKEISLEYVIDGLIISYDETTDGNLREKEIEIIKELIGSLPDGSAKETVEMFYINGMNVREIAQRLGIPESTVTTRLCRFRGGYRRKIISRILALRGDG